MNSRSTAVASLVLATLLLASKAGHAQVSAVPAIGDVVDRLNGIPVYFNGAIAHSSGRNITVDGYNLGLRYQCVEFVKRYYYQRLKHRMPVATGNALNYFDAKVADGDLNKSRGLLQYRNGSSSAPQVEDILVFGPRPGNPYGHIAIVSAVNEASLEIIQQNPGAGGHSRQMFPLLRGESGVTVNHPRVLGWLRLPGRKPAPAEVTPPPTPSPETTPPPNPAPPPAAVPQEVPPPEAVPQLELPVPDSLPVPSEPQQFSHETPEAPSAKGP